MSLRKASTVKDTTTVTITDPHYPFEPLKNADGTEMTVVVHGPFSPKYKQIELSVQNARMRKLQSKKGRANFTAEEIEQSAEEMLIACIESWNLTVDKDPLEFSEPNVRKVFQEFPWVRSQIDAVIGDETNFLEKSATK